MKKYLSTLLLLLCSVLAFAEMPSGDVKPSIKIWNITEKCALTVPNVLDSSLFTVANENDVNNYSIANSYNGTLGSPLQSKIYFDRTEKSDFLFSRPYDAYFTALADIPFFNTHTPYANLNYTSYGGTKNAEEDFKALFSINANKNWNVTGLFNFMRGLGLYSNQATKKAKAGLWSSYDGKYYSARGAFMYQTFDNEENGGISDLNYITQDSLSSYAPENYPVYLTNGSMSRYTNHYFYYNHKFHFARAKHQIDSTHFEWRPIASIGHTFMWERGQKRYRETDNSGDSSFYANTYFSGTSTLDSARFQSMRNNVSLSIDEGFTKYFPFSVVAYVEQEHRSYYMLNDTVPERDTENNLMLGAEIAKSEGHNLLINATGESYIAGERQGDFLLEGTLKSSFDLWKNTIAFKAHAFVKNTSPSYFENKYISNHFKWNNDFDKTVRSRVDATFSWKNKWIDAAVGAGVENVKDYIYFNDEAMIAQCGDNIQIVDGRANLNLSLGVLHLDNKAVYQQTSDDNVLPLPKLSLYDNLYFAFHMFKVLHTQLGVDMSYHTSYYAPCYMPATGAFYTQHATKIGDYPLMSLYASFHLRTARFFFKYYHFNESFGNKEYLSMPNYPLYQGRFQMGISWNFYD